MQKKVTVVLVCLAAAVYAWAATTNFQIQTKLANSGGTMQVRDKALQTIPGVIAYNTFSTSAPIPVTVTLDPGYKFDKINRNNTWVTILDNMTSHYVTTFQKSGGSVQALVPYFTAKKFSVTTSTSGAGSITPTSITDVAYNGSVTVVATPTFTNGIVTSAKVNGATYPASYPYPGALSVTVNNITAPTTISASFDTITAHVGPDQATTTNTATQLSGSVTNAAGEPTSAATIAWEASGPATVDTTRWNTLTPTFTPTVAGIYTFKLKAMIGGTTLSTSAATTVEVYSDIKEYMRIKCMGCHATNGVKPYYYVFTGWTASKHRFDDVNCVTCHGLGAMPTPVNSATVNKTTFIVTSPVAGTVGAHFCSNCHKEPARVHNTAGMLCSTCHNSAANHNFDTTMAARLDVCFSCHGGVNKPHYFTGESIPPNQCLYCHNPKGHDPRPTPAVTAAHFNGYTSPAAPGYAAAYVTPSTACADCHVAGNPTTDADKLLRPYREAWAGSRHGTVKGSAWTTYPNYNWKSLGTFGANTKVSAGIVTDCQRCHTATGYLQFVRYTSITPIASPPVAYSEPLGCNACHTSGDFSAPLTIGPRTGYYNYSSAVTGRVGYTKEYPDSGRSNICLGCHVGRGAGWTIAAISERLAQGTYSTSFWRNTPLIDSHYLSAGGQVFGVTGYHYPGVDYANGGVNHSRVGSDTGKGSCVACHMPGSSPSHTLYTSAGDFTLCNVCHRDDGTVSARFLSDKTAQFGAGLKALAAALAKKGLPPVLDANGVSVYPYFTATDWGTAATAPGRMGAAFNYHLLTEDPGAFAHNPTYVKRLVRDSIDYLMNGNVLRSRDLSATIAELLGDTTDKDLADKFLSNAGSGAAACSVCHANSLDPQSGRKIFDVYTASKHARKADGATCVDCHTSGQPVAHPPAAMLSDRAVISGNCLTAGCHKPHSWSSKGKCMNCHNAHNPGGVKLGPPHYGSYSAAQFVTTNVSCDNCHTALDTSGETSFNIYTANVQWARSGKANIKSKSWMAYDFKAMGTAAATPATSAATDCVRCHTTTGYINYVSSGFRDISAWGISGAVEGGDRKREMVACSACHNPTPFKSFDGEETDEWGDLLEPAFGRRNVAEVTAYYNYSGGGSPRVLKRAIFDDQGASNNCIVCHSGTRAGTTLKQIAKLVGTTFWNNTPFIDPHGMGAAGVLYAKSGYTYPVTRSRNYTAPRGFAHPFIDDYYYGGQGPCVACHLYTERPHLFSPISSAGNGTITKITAYEDVCSECHDRGSHPVDLSVTGNLQGKKQGYLSSLKALSAVLAAKGIHFNPGLPPYFFNIGDQGQQGPEATWYKSWNTGAYTGADLMGAAFNLRLLWGDKGAYTHNSYYARRLIYDSLDFLDDGLMNSTVDVTLQNLSTTDSFTPADKTNARGYIGTRP